MHMAAASIALRARDSTRLTCQVKPQTVQGKRVCVMVAPSAYSEQAQHMSTFIAIVRQDGSLEPAPYHADTMAEAAELEPPGIYTVSRTFHHDKCILLDAHFDRLEESAQLEGIPLELDRKRARKALRSLVVETGYEEARFRLTVPRDDPHQLILTVEPLQLVTEAMRRNGVQVATLYLPRPNPRAKRTEWVAIRNDARKLLPSPIYEGIRLASDGTLSEGFSSNFYGLLEGVLHTAEEDILHGVARRIVLSVAPGLLPVLLKPVHKDDIPQLDEAFLSSSGRGVVPIVRIDDVTIGKGKPGVKTMTIMKRYNAWVDQHLELI